jgi:hypothetical protein
VDAHVTTPKKLLLIEIKIRLGKVEVDTADWTSMRRDGRREVLDNSLSPENCTTKRMVWLLSATKALNGKCATYVQDLIFIGTRTQHPTGET